VDEEEGRGELKLSVVEADKAGDTEGGVLYGRDDTGTPSISASAAGEEEASRLLCRCRWRDLT